MRKNLTVLFSLFLFTSFLFSSMPFISDYFHEKVVIVCFENEVVGNRNGIIDFEIADGVVKTGINSFDKLAQQHNFIDISQFIGPVKDLDWNENGIYIQNIYRIFLKDNKNIETALDALSKDLNIIFAEYETIDRNSFIPNDPSFSDQWHLPQINCPEAWDYTTGGDEIIIGIVDAGIYWTHPDLRDNIWVNQAELDAGMSINWETGAISGGNGIDEDGNNKVDDVIGYSFYGNDNNDSYQDYASNDHGTHVAGCAGAVGNNEIGLCGSSLNVKLISSRHAPTNTDYPYVQDGYAGITYCADSGASVINCSWGGPGSGAYPNTVVNYATNHGALVVTAAGNDDIEHNSTYQDYPSDCTNALCVAATDQDDVKTYFSDYGEPIDVSCPGIGIKSTIIGGTGYASYQGTSMAAPIVAGVAALVKSVHPEFSPLEIRERIMFTTDFIDTISGNEAYAGLLGTGRVNAFTATMYDVIPKLDIIDYIVSESEGDGDGVPNIGETVNLSLIIQNAMFSNGFWAEANDVVITFSTDMAGVTIVEGTETVNVGYVGQASIIDTDSSPVQIITEFDENILVIPITVVITANPSTEYPFYKESILNVQLTLNQAGWPFEMGGGTSSSAMILNLDNSGAKEIIFSDNSGLLHAFTPDGETELAGFPVDFGEIAGTISSSAAIGNLNEDDFQEIVVANEAGYIIAVGAGGEILFSYDAGGQFKSNPIIADIDNNGSNEVIAFSFTPAQAIVLNADGSSFGSSPYSLSAGVLSSSAVGDLNGNNSLELIAISMNGSIQAIDFATGENIAGWPYSLGIGSWNGPIVSNIDSDPEPEILVGSLNGKLVAIDHNGSMKFENNVGGQIKTSVVTGDLNGNGSIEIIFANTIGSEAFLHVLDGNNDWNDLENFPFTIGSQVESTPVLADMDNNGSIEIIFGDTGGYLHSVNINGMETANFPSYVQSGIKVSPVIGDIDNDGDPEIAIANQSSYILLDYKRSIGDVVWGCFKNDPQRRGNAYYETLPTHENSIPSTITVLGKNYPNPFNPETTIEFNLANESKTTLVIYNIKGQKVKTLINGDRKAGFHQVVWQGKDEIGNQVANGVYLYRLKSNNYTSIRKMLMLK
ncbi:MAG: S8 family serine peptidase [Candidatus Cloacimonetes bacterium]|nr:S8 family serine peptidase [Candidatus Cloacimonadota bacterium]